VILAVVFLHRRDGERCSRSWSARFISVPRDTSAAREQHPLREHHLFNSLGDPRTADQPRKIQETQ